MEHPIDLAVPASVALAELTGEGFLRDFAAELGIDMVALSLGRSGDQTLASMDWRLDTGKHDVPDLARRFLPEHVQMRWDQAWGPLRNGRARGTIEVAIVGRPSATTSGECRLVAVDPGCRLTTSTTTRAQLPRPLAGRVEALIDRDLVGWILSVQGRLVLERSGA
ncbi:MAG: DUF2505 domain-containing protein [Candidatus Nanopelagicales bacterium]